VSRDKRAEPIQTVGWFLLVIHLCGVQSDEHPPPNDSTNRVRQNAKSLLLDSPFRNRVPVCIMMWFVQPKRRCRSDGLVFFFLSIFVGYARFLPLSFWSADRAVASNESAFSQQMMEPEAASLFVLRVPTT